MTKAELNATVSPIDMTPVNGITPLNLIGRRLLTEVGICPSYNQIKHWSYDCRFRTVRIGNRAGVAEADWPAARDAIVALASPK